MSNKQDRLTKEGKSLFQDPAFQRQAWASVGQAILQRPAQKQPVRVDKDGNETYDSEVGSYCYSKLAADAKKVGTEVTELEMIMACQAMKARFDTSAAMFIRDTVGAKPVDESKVNQTITNEYESLSDEELELLAKHREDKLKEKCKSAEIELPVNKNAEQIIIDEIK